ncbi:MAG: 6-phosphofructokinase [Capsulimonadaceae bacterium]|nr:6-phosphofructokinase [Capsulimonadaceae bacterium]
MKRIAVLTSGGDAPGMNAAIRAVTRTAISSGVDVIGVRRGFAGLIDADFIPLGPRQVAGKIEVGGTFLESARCPEFKTEEGQKTALRNLETYVIDGVIVIGGNGSQTGAHALSKLGIPVNGVASTIDNDLAGSDSCIGVDTALNTALDAIDKLRTTASSHHRLFIVEVMGRDCGYLALTVGVAGGAEVIVAPEFDLSPDEVVRRVHKARERGKMHAIIVVAEGCVNRAQEIYAALKADIGAGFDPRLTIIGHVQRGGAPTAFDRLIATRLGARACELLLAGEHGNLIGFVNGKATPTPYSEVTGHKKPLPEDLIKLIETMSI